MKEKVRPCFNFSSLKTRRLGDLLLIITALITQASSPSTGFLYYSHHSGFSEKFQGKDTLWMTGWRMQSWHAPQQVDTFLNEDHVLLKAICEASCPVPHPPYPRQQSLFDLDTTLILHFTDKKTIASQD